MKNVMKKRQSHGLNLPQPSDARDSVVSNILSSLATLDETAQLQWIQQTSRQVDHERAYQKRENGGGVVGGRVHVNGYDQYDGNGDSEYEEVHMPMTGVGYRRKRVTNTSLGIITPVAPSPAVPMGRPCKRFFRKFMGIGPKVAIENDLLISTQPPYDPVQNSNSVYVFSDGPF